MRDAHKYHVNIFHWKNASENYIKMTVRWFVTKMYMIWCNDCTKHILRYIRGSKRIHFQPYIWAIFRLWLDYRSSYTRCVGCSESQVTTWRWPTYRAETCSCSPSVLLDEIYSTVCVIHKNFLLLNQHNGDDAPQNGVGTFDLTKFEVHKKDNFFTNDVGVKCPLFKQDYKDHLLTFRDLVYRIRYAWCKK